MDTPIITAENLHKTYKLYSKPRHRLLELVTGGRVLRHMVKHALDGVSFSLQAGDRLGILGENGSGKSTLLKILTGILTPTSGQVTTRGRIAALLELGTGFHPDLTGVENVFQNGYIMGYSREEMQRRCPMIVEFSELGDAVNYPVKSYSSGMLMRLGFACSVFVEPDILIVDEALSVGDAYFQTKCFYKIKDLINRGTTFIYVSHAQDAVRSLCNKGIVLENGRIVAEGTARDVAEFYNSRMHAKMNSNCMGGDAASFGPESATVQPAGRPTASKDELFSESKDFAARVAGLRQGNGQARFTDVQLVSESGAIVHEFHPGEMITVRLSFAAHMPLTENFGVGISVADESGNEILQCLSSDYGVFFDEHAPDSRHVIEFRFKNILSYGRYSLITALDWIFPDPTMPGLWYTKGNFDRCYGSAIFHCTHDGRTLPRGKVGHHYDVTIRA